MREVTVCQPTMTAGGKPVNSHAASYASSLSFDYGWRAVADSRRICTTMRADPRWGKFSKHIKSGLRAFYFMQIDPLCNFKGLERKTSLLKVKKTKRTFRLCFPFWSFACEKTGQRGAHCRFVGMQEMWHHWVVRNLMMSHKCLESKLIYFLSLN